MPIQILSPFFHWVSSLFIVVRIKQVLYKFWVQVHYQIYNLYCSFVVSFETRKFQIQSWILQLCSLRDYFGCSAVSFTLVSACQFLEKKGFESDCVEYVDQFGEHSHPNIFQSMNMECLSIYLYLPYVSQWYFVVFTVQVLYFFCSVYS